MLSLASGKEGQNARLAAKLTGWRITIQSQANKDLIEAGEPAEALNFEPFAPGEEPDIDIIPDAEEMAAEIAVEPVAPTELAPAAAVEPAAQPAVEAPEEEEVSFAAIVNQMAVPKGEERESEDYGEDEDEEYEIPTTVVTESRPAAIRFGEDLIRREEPEVAKPAAKKQRRPSRFNEEEEDDMDDIEYSGRIH